MQKYGTNSHLCLNIDPNTRSQHQLKPSKVMPKTINKLAYYHDL